MDDWKLRDVDMMKNPMQWPVRPVLAMKHYEGRHTMPSFGVMLEGDPKPTIYVGVSISDVGAEMTTSEMSGRGFTAIRYDAYMPPERVASIRSKLSHFEKQEFESFEAMVEAGWVVD
jgi:hypothetical protein